jgi:hypothetical protein
MNTTSDSSPAPTCRLQPALDPRFQPAVLVNRAFRDAARATGRPVPVRLALEQADGSVFHHHTLGFPETDPRASGNYTHVQRLVKFLLWARGGFRVCVDGPPALAEALRQHYLTSKEGQFDADLMGHRVYERPFEVVATGDLPPERAATQPLGRHLDGCRIGFDLGGSDRKVAAVVNGEVVFSEETVWDPYHQKDPQYHFDGIMDSLRKAAAHLPKVEAIGGSAAGVYVNNQVKVASLFRGVPPDLFQARVKPMFFEIQRAWDGVPLEVVNDGEVTALAGSMALGRNAVLGLALGTSQAAGYVTPEGNITSWLNELAFAPVDDAPGAPVDEWSGDHGCGVQYFSQQAVGRLVAPRRHRAAAGHALRGETQGSAEAHGRGRRAGAPPLRNHRHLPGLRRGPLRRILRHGERAGAGPRHQWSGRRDHPRLGAGGVARGVPGAGRTHPISHSQRKRKAPRPGHRRRQPAHDPALLASP